MSAQAKHSLLIVLPGGIARRPVLERLQRFACVHVLVAYEDVARSEWAKAMVGSDHWIESEGSTQDLNHALSAVQTWLQAGKGIHRIDGIATYDDFATELCAHLCECLGVPGTPLGTVRMLRNKIQFRRQCADAGLPAAKHAPIFCVEDVDALLAEQDQWTYPVVLKPAKGAGSWHVCKVDSPAELRGLWLTLSSKMQLGSFPQEVKDAGFTMEEYFGGHEVDIDGWARNGKLEFCMVSDNRPAKEPHFLELGGIYPSQLTPAAVAVLEKLAAQVVQAFPGLHTCFHLEMKINAETLEAMPIELNVRVGGAECPASVEAVTGYYLPEVMACVALGMPAMMRSVDDDVRRFPIVASANLHVFESGILTECSDDNLDTIATNVVVCCLSKQGVGKMHQPNNGSMSCLAWLSCGGQTLHEAEQNLQTAISQLQISVSSTQACILACSAAVKVEAGCALQDSALKLMLQPVSSSEYLPMLSA